MAGNNGDARMLARRFTIVCLIAMLFGMGFALLVAEASRFNRKSFNGTAICNLSCPHLTRR
jgi:hypothetical protein